MGRMEPYMVKKKDKKKKEKKTRKKKRLDRILVL
jgi:hypothetical protein